MQIRKILYLVVMYVGMVQPLIAMEVDRNEEKGVKTLFDYCMYATVNRFLKEAPEKIKNDLEYLNDDVKDQLRTYINNPLNKYYRHTQLHKAPTGLRVRQLLAMGADVHALTSLQETPLHSLLKENKIAAAYALLESTTNINVTHKDADDITPLDLVIKTGNTRLIKLIEQHGVPYTSLSSICYKAMGKCNETISTWFQTLEDQKIATTAHCCFAQPTVYDCKYYINQFPNQIQKQCITFLNTPVTRGGHTYFHCAQTSQEVKNLHALSVDHNALTTQKETPLHFMIKCGNRQAALALLQLLEDRECNTIDTSGFTPLCSAVRVGDTPLVLALLAKKVNATCQHVTKKGVVSPLHMVVPHAKKYNIMDALYREACKTLCADQRIDFMRLAVEHDNPYLLRKLLPKNHTIDSYYAGNMNLLLYALANEHMLCIKKLLSGEAQICKRSQDGRYIVKATEPISAQCSYTTIHNITPLMVAAEKGYYEVILQLIDKGVPLESFDQEGNTALVYAVSEGFMDVVTLLLDHGVDVNHANLLGGTPLHHAVDKENIDMVKLLLQKGADASREDSFGRTPLYYALHDKWNPLIVKALRNAGKNGV